VNRRVFSTFQLFLLFLICALTARPVQAADFTREEVKVPVPDVVLLNQKGKRVRLNSFLSSDKPVVVDFIYATCTTICPVLSAGVVNIQRKSAALGKDVKLVSITIDPENDTPAVMDHYLKRYHAKPGWDFLTGSRSDIESVMEAFDAYVSDKMDHLPLYFIKTPGSTKWVRVQGFIDGEGLMKEIEKG